MNYLFAIVFMIGVLYFGGRPVFDPDHVIVGTVSEDGPAAKAGLKPDDIIIAAGGRSVSDFDSLRSIIMAIVKKPVQITWISGTDTISKPITTMAHAVPQPEGDYDTVGAIGFTQKPLRYEHPSLASAAVDGFVAVHVIVIETFKFVKKVVTGQASAKMIGGPLFIAQQSGKEAEKGASSLIFFMVLLSVNLAVLNILPIPILDGGHLVFLAIEKLKGSPVSNKVRTIAQQVGLVLLLTLIVFVTYNDIVRVIRGL
jgi:regulator of sigma E protease